MIRQKIAGISKFILILIGFLIGTLGFFLEGCIQKKPIRIGVALQLTGRQAELGVQERNAVQFAVEEIDAAGGIAGRPVELIICDDLGTPEGARSAVGELVAAGVAGIIGPATSGQAMAGVPGVNDARIVMISPTVSSPVLSGRDDYFFRVVPAFTEGADFLAKRAKLHRGVTRMAILYDRDNAVYADTYSAAVAERFRKLGGTVVDVIGFSSKTEPDFASLLSQVLAKKANGIVVVASDVDTAFIAQRTRIIGWEVPLFTSNWAMTETLILNGGKAVEGLEGEQGYDMNSELPALLDFKSHYQARFGQPPTFGAAFAYEAARILAAALRQTGGKAGGLKQALLEMRDFKGLVDTFSFNKYGDVERPHFISVIHQGRFVTVDVVKPKVP